jgi:glycosyltransferase involved in cell wall biosynthesis
MVIDKGDIRGILSAINEIKEKGKSYYSKSCRERAANYYDKEKKYREYIDLYNSLVK